MIFDRLKSLRPRNLRLGSKLMITYLLITAIPLAILGTISYAQYADSVERQAGEYMPKFLEQANADIDKRLAALADMPERLFASEKILSILRSGGSQSISDYNRDATRMNSFLADAFVNGSNPEVLGAYILSSQRLFHSAKWVFQEKDWEWQLRRYAGQEAKPDEMRLILPGELKLHFANKIPYAMIKKTILDADNRKVLGSMFIAVDLSFIDGIFRQFNADDQASIWYMNEAGVIIYSGDRERIGTVDEEKSHYPVGSGSFRTRGGGGELISVNESPLGLTLAHSVPVRRLLAGVDKVRDATLAVFFGIIVVTSAVSAYLSWRFIRPLKKLGGLMKNVEMGHFEVDYSLQSPDEIGSLARSLNSMIETIRDLIQKNYQIEIRQKEAELYALQSQINPHFMYNTLETIGMAVEDGEKEAVVDMVTLLGRMLRFSVSNSSKSVLIAEELQHVRDYLAIQKFRFEGRLSSPTRSPSICGNGPSSSCTRPSSSCSRSWRTRSSTAWRRSASWTSS